MGYQEELIAIWRFDETRKKNPIYDITGETDEYYKRISDYRMTQKQKWKYCNNIKSKRRLQEQKRLNRRWDINALTLA